MKTLLALVVAISFVFQDFERYLTDDDIKIRHISSGIEIARDQLWNDHETIRSIPGIDTIYQDIEDLYGGVVDKIEFNKCQFLIAHELEKFGGEYSFYSDEFEIIMGDTIVFRVGDRIDTSQIKFKHRIIQRNPKKSSFSMLYWYEKSAGNYIPSDFYLVFEFNPENMIITRIHDFPAP